MCKPDKTYHCTVRNLNQTLVAEYDITVSREFNNVLDNNDTKQNDDINISDAETNNKKDNASLGVKIFFGFVFVLNIISMLLIFYLFSLLLPSMKDKNESVLNLAIVFFILFIILIILLYMLIYQFMIIKNKNPKLLPTCDASFKSFGFYVVVLSTMVGTIFSCITSFICEYKPYDIAVNTMYIINSFFNICSLLWFFINLFKASKFADDNEEYITKIKDVIQFCVSVLTLVGVFIGKIDDYYPNIGFLVVYALTLAIFLFAPFTIPIILKVFERKHFIMVKHKC